MESESCTALKQALWHLLQPTLNLEGAGDKSPWTFVQHPPVRLIPPSGSGVISIRGPSPFPVTHHWSVASKLKKNNFTSHFCLLTPVQCFIQLLNSLFSKFLIIVTWICATVPSLLLNQHGGTRYVTGYLHTFSSRITVFHSPS